MTDPPKSILFRDRWTASKPSLEHSIASVDPDKLSAEYEALRKKAPHRHDVGKAYFVEHSGAPSSGGHSNRLEEHYAMALWNLDCLWPRSVAATIAFSTTRCRSKPSRRTAASARLIS